MKSCTDTEGGRLYINGGVCVDQCEHNYVGLDGQTCVADCSADKLLWLGDLGYCVRECTKLVNVNVKVVDGAITAITQL